MFLMLEQKLLLNGEMGGARGIVNCSDEMKFPADIQASQPRSSWLGFAFPLFLTPLQCPRTSVASVLNSLGDCFPFCLQLMLLLINTANGILCSQITGLQCMNLLYSVFFKPKVLERCMPLDRNKKRKPIILALLNLQIYVFRLCCP